MLISSLFLTRDIVRTESFEKGFNLPPRDRFIQLQPKTSAEDDEMKLPSRPYYLNNWSLNNPVRMMTNWKVNDTLGKLNQFLSSRRGNRLEVFRMFDTDRDG